MGHPGRGPSAGRVGPSGDPLEGLADPLQGADVAVAGRRLADPEHLRRLGVAQLLEVPQAEHLAIDRGEVVERILDPDLELGPRRRLARRREPAEQLGRQRDGAGVRHDEAAQPDLPARVTHPGAQVPPVHRLEPHARDVAEPQEHRDLRVAEESRQRPGELDVRLLQDVRRVHPAMESAVQADLDHPAEAIPMVHEQGAGVPPCRPIGARGRDREIARGS